MQHSIMRQRDAFQVAFRDLTREEAAAFIALAARLQAERERKQGAPR